MVIRRICYIIGIACLILALIDLQEPKDGRAIMMRIEQKQAIKQGD